MKQETRITTERIGVLIGKQGQIKRDIEERTSTSIQVDSDKGLVTIEGEDADRFIRAVEMIKAISRGFSPERASCLLEDEDLYLEIINLGDIADNPNQLERIRGRIIGKNGFARSQIEDLTRTSLSVYGKTVAIIGTFDQIKTTKEAIEMLITGAPHEAVFSFLEKKRREAKRDMLGYYY
ncbi:MAG: RNA-processing protein [Methanospirillaceae archaeon]|nr:RNA-processing protein [Methanospirillaceae archaeon]